MVKVGIDRIDSVIDIFNKKRVGLITNPTGVNRDLISTIDILYEKTNLVSLFSPEHGIRGELQAGIQLDDYTDLLTGCTVYSLYGKNKKPTSKMMDTIDILAFDIQDVGARFYTYLYTMAYAMIACHENEKKMVIFDRPNPVNANEVEGNILNTKFQSFVGYYPIVQRYGLTIGELATLFNEEFNIQCDLTIVKMEGYQRTMDYFDTGLKWIFPSPNLPSIESTYLYLSNCIFEGTNLSEGRGTTKPFQIIGSPYLDHVWLKNTLNQKQIRGVAFRTLYFTPTFSKHQGKLCKGIECIVTDKSVFKPVKLGYIILDLIRNHHPEFAFIKPFKEGMHPFVDLLTGNNYVRHHTFSIDEQLNQIDKDTQVFKDLKRRYHFDEYKAN